MERVIDATTIRVDGRGKEGRGRIARARDEERKEKQRHILRGRSLIHPGRKPSSVFHSPIGAMLSVVSSITIAKQEDTHVTHARGCFLSGVESKYRTNKFYLALIEAFGI